MPRPRFSPGTHCTGDCVGPRAGLDTEARGKILSSLPGIEPRSPSRATRSQTLYWLSYPAHHYLRCRKESVHITPYIRFKLFHAIHSYTFLSGTRTLNSGPCSKVSTVICSKWLGIIMHRRITYIQTWFHKYYNVVIFMNYVCSKVCVKVGWAMAQMVSCPPFTADAQGSGPGHSECDLWWTKWHWDRLLYEFFGLPLSVSFHRDYILICHLGDEQ
jgi:hypothetical protein